MNLQDISRELTQFFEADPDIWKYSHGSERILILTNESTEGIKLDAVSRLIDPGATVREGRVNCIFTFSVPALFRFYEGTSLALLHIKEELRYEGRVDDVFKGAEFLAKVIEQIKTFGGGGHLH
jgi:hypothetical protein